MVGSSSMSNSDRHIPRVHDMMTHDPMVVHGDDDAEPLLRPVERRDSMPCPSSMPRRSRRCGDELSLGYCAGEREEILWLGEACHLPVIWATEVLDRAAHTGLATRAEITDAAMSVRAEAVMLTEGRISSRPCGCWPISSARWRHTNTRSARCIGRSPWRVATREAWPRRGPSRPARTQFDAVACPHFRPLRLRSGCSTQLA